MPCDGDHAAFAPSDFKRFTQAAQQVADILDDAADNAIVSGLVRTIRTLRMDADRHGELLAMLCIAQNRDAIRHGGKAAIDQLFDLIDTYADGHKMRLVALE